MGNTNVKPHPKPRSKKQLRWKAADRPSTPGIPSLLEENGSVPDVVHICWAKPAKDGGSTVTSYLVEHRRVGTSHWLQSSPQPTTNNELTVIGLEPGWRYLFRVRAQNAVGLSDPSEISEAFTVTLQRSAIAAPKFTQELEDRVALENDKVEYEVHFLGQPPPTICWFKDGFEIFSGNRTRITTLSDKSILTILHAAISDEGEIRCTATNKAGHTSTKCRLTIDAPPTIILPRSYQDQDGIIFEIGETIKMNVTVSGKPTPLIFWSHDGDSIQNNDRYEIEYNDKTASVKIENALRTDRGEYRIKAVNKLGQDQASFLVTITDKPTPPGKAKVLLTSGRSVTLCWSTPTDDGGCRVGNYIIEYYRIGWDVWLKAATTRQQSTMLGDLIEGSQYKFRVKAESPYGVSDPSEESEVVFIPDPKRGIQEPNDVVRVENDTRAIISKRRRANSTPRVSFVLDDDAPVRPERKKTGKTPEASPRFKRKQYPFFGKNNIGSDPALNRKFSIPYSVSSPNQSPRTTWDNSLRPSTQDVSSGRTTIIKVEKHKSPSPEIIVTDTDIDNQNRISKPIGNLNRFGASPSRNRSPFENSSSSNLKLDMKVSSSPPKPSSPRSPNILEKASPSRIPTRFEKSPSRSPDELQNSSSGSPNHSETSPSWSPEKLYLPQTQDPFHFEKSPSWSPNHLEKSPSRSPSNFQKSPSRSPEPLEKKLTQGSKNVGKMSPNRFEASASPVGNKQEILSRNSGDTNRSFQERRSSLGEELKKNEEKSLQMKSKNENTTNATSIDNIRPPLARQEFSGSSEFMLVLCPEGEQGTRFKKFGISFDENSIPPPLSLSAPELGIEPPETPSLRRWSSSTELLTYRLMERLHEAVMNENNLDGDIETNTSHSNIPRIQVNSEPAAHPEDGPTLTRRLSGVLPHNQTWSAKRYSLKNPNEMSDILGTRLHKFEESEQMRREVSEYRRISESEHEEVRIGESMKGSEEEWLKDYEESVPSEEESELSSSDEGKLPKIPYPRNDIEDDDEEIYNPRDRMMSAVKTDSNKPFEILTIRKNPPNPNIQPKPILKKPHHNTKEENSLNIKSLPKSKNRNRRQLPGRNRSNSLGGVSDDEIDVTQIKISPTPGKRRSFSLMPSQANFITDAFKTKNQKDNKASASESKEVPAKNVSALATFTSIAGAGFIIPNEMHEKKEAEEEAKVVVDFYGDIVKSFGGKSKPTAEFSRTVVSKYDTYEERKISDIKPNADSLAHTIRPISPKNAEVDVLKQPPKNISREGNIQPLTHDFKLSGNNPMKQPTTSYQESVQPIEKLKSDHTCVKNETDDVQTWSRKDTSQGIDEALKQMKTELSSRSSVHQKENTGNRFISDMGRQHRETTRSGRPGSRQTSVGRRRRKTPMSRDASTSPVRFSDDWDSQCSSRNSLEDYYNRGSITSSRASSLSRRSLSPPKPKLRGITTQTSFRIEPECQVDAQQREDLAKVAERRMSFVFGYFTDAAMVGVAAWLYVFQNEYLAIPFIVVPIYRQLDNRIKMMNAGIKRRLPKWLRKKFEKNS